MPDEKNTEDTRNNIEDDEYGRPDRRFKELHGEFRRLRRLKKEQNRQKRKQSSPGRYVFWG
jgi:hypothetical protein